MHLLSGHQAPVHQAEGSERTRMRADVGTVTHATLDVRHLMDRRITDESLGEIELKQQVNVELILDASGSMAERVGGEPKLATAKRVLIDFISTLPKNANVALRIYGHQGSSADADKAVSCASSELLYPFQPPDTARFHSAIQAFQPAGWTPLARSFDDARRDFERFDPANSSNFVYVVTDGIETCDADPVASAGQLHAANVKPSSTWLASTSTPRRASSSVERPSVAAARTTKPATRTSSARCSGRRSIGLPGRRTTTVSSQWRTSNTTRRRTN